ncbi:ammonia-forming cytochrome c nitrite reductase subunit c552 [Shewanella maritima]|uniref:nitrite reductase (cytochrome; ammonia-forming) n=2 Tax=Shewanella maritima TaxID=2520507 RepID=A0A411PGK1_9GAMM|nr:ammonia-forming cytochrome c nitrite reductase subunit c552 [Shewanella maritima]
MKLQKLAIAVAVMTALSACGSSDDDPITCKDGEILNPDTNVCEPEPEPEPVDYYNSDNWKEAFPEQHESWAKTAENNPESGKPTDLLEANPNLVAAWAGYGFAKDYNRARGHHFALTDIITTLRTGAPMVGMDGEIVGETMAASCWSCKTTDVARLYEEKGEGKFSNNGWSVWGDEMGNTIGCSDCHDHGKSDLRLSRPYTDRAMTIIDKTFAAQSHDMQSSQTCAQCHVEYYFDGTDEKKVRYPWDFWVPGVETDYADKVAYQGTDDLYKGFAAEAQLAYFDDKGFKDWTNAISGAPMLKAQHPEFENLLDRTKETHPSPSNHLEFSCNTCHMPKSTNAEGEEYSNHQVNFSMAKLPSDCTGCHTEGGIFDINKIVEERKAEIDALRFGENGTDLRLTEVHFKAQAIWAANNIEGLDAGKSIGEAKANYEAALAAGNELATDMNSLLVKVRNAQWFWDSATASHGIAAHNPAEAKRLLTKANTVLDAAIAEADTLLTKYGSSYTFDKTMYDSKAKLQPLAGLNLDQMNADKETFIKERVEKEWPAKLESY